MVSDTTAPRVNELVEQLTRAADRGYTVRGEPDASTLMRQAAEALSAQPTVDREAIARAAYKADFLEGAEDTYDEAFADRMWEWSISMPISGPGFLARWHAIADSILAILHPIKNTEASDA